MEPILNRAEIADLLGSIHNGQVSLDLEDEQEDFLACTPVKLFQLARNFSISLTHFDDPFVCLTS